MEIISIYIDNYLFIFELNRLEDILVFINLFLKVIGRFLKFWGSNIIGYGNLFYKYFINIFGYMFIIGLFSRK